MFRQKRKLSLLLSKNHKVKRISDEDWQEILDEVNMDFFPVEYLNSIIIKFENGTIWDIDINGSRKTHTLEDIEDTLDELFEEYEDSMETINFKLDLERIKHDLSRRVYRFLKTNK